MQAYSTVNAVKRRGSREGRWKVEPENMLSFEFLLVFYRFHSSTDVEVNMRANDLVHFRIDSCGKNGVSLFNQGTLQPYSPFTVRGTLAERKKFPFCGSDPWVTKLTF